MILLPQYPECTDYRHAPSCPAQSLSFSGKVLWAQIKDEGQDVGEEVGAKNI
jgi:hypothetical protein